MTNNLVKHIASISHGHRLRAVILIVILAVVLLLVGFTRIEPGHVGIKVHYSGGQRGVDDFPTQMGWVFYLRGFSTVLEWPVFTQTVIWTRSQHEGKAINEEISFNSKEGMPFTADVSVSYRLESEKVPHFYVRFRTDDMGIWSHGYLRNVTRDAFNEEGTRYTAEEVYGERKEEFLKASRQRVQEHLKTVGVLIEQFGFVGPPRPPEPVAKAIEAKIKAIQDAIRTENEVRATRAEAAKRIAEAEGLAKATIARAEGDAKANAILAASITANLLHWRQLELQQQTIAKWNGVRPQFEGVSGGGGFLFNVPMGKTQSNP
jgi:regulator of protease activity HflC (stomatin/prohibitin superfamily)